MATTQTDDLADQTALVTGATSGIGRAIALQLAATAPKSSSTAADATRGAETVEAIIDEGGRARFVPADLSDPADLQRLVEDVGAVDVLVNSAGFSWFGPTADLDVETFDALFASDVRAPYFLVAALAPKMAAKGKGSIINVSSMAGQIGLAGGAAYGATKGAMSSMTRAWAAEFSPSGVRVNAIAPGPVFTAGASAERIEALGTTTLLNRAANVDEIAEVVGFLASPARQLRHRRDRRRRWRSHRGLTPSGTHPHRLPEGLDELDARHGRVVAGARAELQDPRVAAVAVGVARPDLGEELVRDVLVVDRRDDLALLVHAAVLRLGDELLGVGPQRLGLGLGGA